jgi:RNA polymerase sigma factor (sigma-70 family)
MAAPQLCALLGQIEKLSRGPCKPQRTDRQLLEDFAACQDESAFAALVARHGSLVLRVCRRVLRHEQDAEDAFQATFLVLAQQNASIQNRDSLAGWLHGVAYRTAMKAKRSKTRRCNHEARAHQNKPSSAASPTWDDVQSVLDEEIQRLPATFRTAFVLCVLEGKTVPTAAAEAQCKVGTMSSRLTRARKRLQQQLARRGIKLPALLAALAVVESASAAVPSGLAQTVIRLGLVGAAGGPAAEQLPPNVAALAAGVTRAMFLQKTRIVTLVLIAIGVFAAGAGVLTLQTLTAREQPAASPKSEDPSPAPKLPAIPDKNSITYGGQVLGPDGRPVAGATLYLTPGGGYLRRPFVASRYATTGPDGRFQFSVPKAQFGNRHVVVTATAANHGPGWVRSPAGGPSEDLTIRLVQDDSPILGQIVDLEGKPIVGATLTVLQINAARGEDLGPWLEAVKSKKGPATRLEQMFLEEFTVALSPKVTTDAEGRFRLTGIGRNRLVRAQLDGPTLASQQVCILTRPGNPIEVPEQQGEPAFGEQGTVITYYGSSFRYVAAPTRPVVGVVRDKQTKQPLAGVTVQSDKLANNRLHGWDIIRTTTDAQGRYHLTGMPKGKGNIIKVIPAGDQPHIAIYANVPDSPGLDPVTVDCELNRGVWIEGKITDKVTGKPLRGAVEYYYLEGSPILRDYPNLALLRNYVAAKEDGSYRIIGLPGPGLVAVGYLPDYLRASEREDEEAVKEASLFAYNISHTINYGALARIDPARGVEVVKRDITLDPGWTFTGTVLGPDGQPLAGARGYGLTARLPPWSPEGMKTATFTVRAFNPRRPRDLLVQHREKGLVGVVPLPKENGGPVTVRLGPGAVVTGRLVDADGKPRPGVELEPLFGSKDKLSPWPWTRYSPQRIETDREGRFRIEALLPGYEFGVTDGRARVHSGGILHSGQTKDLGDIQIKRQQE